MPRSRISYNAHGQNIPDVAKFKDHLQRLNPAAVLIMDNITLAQELKTMLPATMVIARTWPDEDLHHRFEPNAWLDRQLSYSGGDTSLTYYTTNESGFTKELIDWHVRLIDYANTKGVSLAVLGLSVGNPDGDPLEKWALARPLLVQLAAHRQHVLSLHEYFCGVPTSGIIGGSPTMIKRGEWPAKVPFTCWHCGRFKFVVDYCQSIGIQPPRIIISEHGADDLSDIESWSRTLPITPPYTKIKGWRTLHNAWKNWYPDWSPEQAYYEMLRWLDEAIYQDSPVEAQLIFSWGHSSDKWVEFDVAGATAFQIALETYAKEQAPMNLLPTPLDTRWAEATNQTGNNFFLRLEPRVSEHPGLAKIFAGEKFSYIPIGDNAEWLYGKNKAGNIGYLSVDVLKVKVEPPPPPPSPPPADDIPPIDWDQDLTALDALIKLTEDELSVVNHQLAKIDTRLKLLRLLKEDIAKLVATKEAA